MDIRPANKQDIPGILELLRQVGEVHHQLRPDIFPAGTLKYDASALETLLWEEDRPVFVAVEDGAVLGYCFCVVKRFPASSSGVERQELYIDDLCVDEHRRGMGIAQLLYQRAREYGRTRRCGSLTLNVWCGNDRAMAFYEKCGLRPRNIMMEIPLEESQC